MWVWQRWRANKQEDMGRDGQIFLFRMKSKNSPNKLTLLMNKERASFYSILVSGEAERGRVCVNQIHVCCFAKTSIPWKHLVLLQPAVKQLLPFVKQKTSVFEMANVLMFRTSLRCCYRWCCLVEYIMYVSISMSVCVWVTRGLIGWSKWAKSSRRQNDIVVVSTIGPETHSLINHMKCCSTNVQLAAMEPQYHIMWGTICNNNDPQRLHSSSFWKCIYAGHAWWLIQGYLTFYIKHCPTHLLSQLSLVIAMKSNTKITSHPIAISQLHSLSWTNDKLTSWRLSHIHNKKKSWCLIIKLCWFRCLKKCFHCPQHLVQFISIKYVFLACYIIFAGYPSFTATWPPWDGLCSKLYHSNIIEQSTFFFRIPLDNILILSL